MGKDQMTGTAEERAPVCARIGGAGVEEEMR